MPEKINLHDLDLHETMKIKTGGRTYTVLRVPGGWIYNYFSSSGTSLSTFVPKNTEYRDTEDPFFVV